MTGTISEFWSAGRTGRVGILQARALRSLAPLVKRSAIDDQFRAIFDLVQDGIFITDPSTGRFIEVNAAGCAMVGYTKPEIIGQDIGLISSGVYPYTLDVAIETSNKAAPGEFKSLDWRCRRRDGSLFWAEVSKHYTKLAICPSTFRQYGMFRIVSGWNRSFSLRWARPLPPARPNPPFWPI